MYNAGLAVDEAEIVARVPSPPSPQLFLWLYVYFLAFCIINNITPPLNLCISCWRYRGHFFPTMHLPRLCGLKESMATHTSPPLRSPCPSKPCRPRKKQRVKPVAPEVASATKERFEESHGPCRCLRCFVKGLTSHASHRCQSSTGQA